jgi:uncharacterized protein with von Willebrand factor type A (vWA) domain
MEDKAEQDIDTGMIFLEFFYLLRAQGVPVSVREWLTWLECIEKGLIAADLGRAYTVGRAVMIKHERHLDTYDLCFAHFFGDAPAPVGLPTALDEWLSSPLDLPEFDAETLAKLEQLDLEELRKMFEERLREQDERHDGGNRWVGTGGTSPFGHNGRHPSGIRVGGSSRSRSAVQVAAARRFRAYRSDRVLDTRQLGAALRRLRRLGRGERAEELDLDETIRQTARHAGDLEVVLKPPRENTLKLILLMDVGGSMDDHARLVEQLFSAAHQASHFKTFSPLYFHNCIYESVYEDAALRTRVTLDDLSRKLDKETRLLIVGDACMSPYELFSIGGAIDYSHMNQRTGVEWLTALREIYPHHAWINPIPERFWGHPTIDAISDLFPMTELTLDGLGQAVERLTRSHPASIH